MGGATVRKRSDVTCDDCYFRKEGLCALRLESPCPTFRHVSRGNLVPPRQARLIGRPLAARLAGEHIAA
jgi:hypothetical protein